MLALPAALLSLLASAFALPQYDYGASATTHTVVVGGPNGELTFTPEAIFANVGDEVIFEFHQKNHSATQSSFANPCGREAGGFDSGFMPVAAGVASGFPTYKYTVQDSKPVWVYCAQANGGHCHAGMVFAINCGADGEANSFTNFKAAAIAQGAGATTSAATATTTALPEGWSTYPGNPAITIPPAPASDVVTSTVVVGASTWTTTYTSYAGSPDPTPSSLEGNVIRVTVGAGGSLAYDPPHVVAKPRDTLVFEFQAKNHTVTQSSFADPCRKLQFTSPTGQIGVDSGFMPVPAGTTTFPTFNVTINDTAPLWFYCRQANHCGQGMVFAVNSDETSPRSFSAFQTLAKEINGTSSATTSAGGVSPSGGSNTTGAASRTGVSMALGVLSIAVGALLL